MTPESAQAYSELFDEAFADSKFGGFVSRHSVDEIEGMKGMLIDNDGETGVLVKDHGDGRIEATALFNTSDEKGAGLRTLKRAVDELGVNYVECFGDALPTLYAKLGFEVTDQFPFDREQAPPGWDYDAHGEPDYFLMGLPAELTTGGAVRYSGGMSDDHSIDITDEEIEQLREDARSAMSPEEWAATGENVFIGGLVAAGVLPPSTPLA